MLGILCCLPAGREDGFRLGSPDLGLGPVEGEPGPGPLPADVLVSVRELVRVQVELGVVSVLEDGGLSVPGPDGLDGPLGRAGSGYPEHRAGQGAPLIDAPLGLDVDRLPVRSPPPMDGLLVLGVPDGHRHIQHRAEVMDLFPHVCPVQGLVGSLHVQGQDNPIRLEPGEGPESMVGLSTTIGCPDPQLVVACGDPGLGLGRSRDGSQAHSAQDAVHDQEASCLHCPSEWL